MLSLTPGIDGLNLKQKISWGDSSLSIGWIRSAKSHSSTYALSTWQKRKYHALSASRAKRDGAWPHGCAPDFSSKILVPGQSGENPQFGPRRIVVRLFGYVGFHECCVYFVDSQHEPLLCEPVLVVIKCTLRHLARELNPLVKVDVFYGRDRHAAVALGKPVDRGHHLNKQQRQEQNRHNWERRREGGAE